MSSTVARGRRCSQPRVLILDITPPGWAAVRGQLCEALGNAFCLGATTAPPGELLSIYIVREKHQCLLPLLQIRGNFLRLRGCLTELRSTPGYGSSAPGSRSLSLAVLDALQQNRQLAQHSARHGYFAEVTVLSTRPGRELATELNEGLKDADLSTLCRLMVVRMSCDTEESGSSGTSPDSGRDEDPSFQVYDIEFRVTPADVLSLESFFKSWMFESSQEREEIRLILPKGDAKLQIICDVQHPLLPPRLLLGTGVAGQDGDQDTRVAQTIRIIRSLSSAGVCGSMLYGLPSVLTPTACWELDWDQLESNQENFQALCHLLQSQELCLLGCQGQQAASGAPPVLSHVIVSASDSPALLLRPVAPRELVLLMKPPALPGPVRESSLQQVQTWVMVTGVTWVMVTGVTGVMVTGVTWVMVTGVTWVMVTGVTGVMVTGVTRVMVTGVTWVMVTGVTWVMVTGVTWVMVTGVTGVMVTGVTWVMVTGVTWVMVTGVTGVMVTGVTRVMVTGVTWVMVTGVTWVMVTGVTWVMVTGVTVVMVTGVTWVMVTGVTWVMVTGVTGVMVTGVTWVMVTGVTGVMVTGVTWVMVTGVTGVMVTGVTWVMVTGVTGVMVTGVTGVMVTGVTWVMVTGVTGVMVTGVTGVMEALRCLDVASMYNPLQVTSNLYEHLWATLSRPAPPARQGATTFRGASSQGRQVGYSRGKARAAVAPLPLVTPAPCKRRWHVEDKSPSKIRFLHDDSGNV
ncbi:meiosis 1 arrest protein [Gastrophryne carolinensis]